MPAKVVPNVKAGTLNRRIQIQQFTGTTDADTQADTDAGITPTLFATVWASIEPQGGTAVGAPNQNLQGVETYLVRTRYFPGVVNGMQVYEPTTGLTLDILAVVDISQIHRQLHLECVSRRYAPV